MLRRDRWIALVGLLALTLGAWLYLAWVATDMNSMSSAMAPGLRAWTAAETGLMFVMWSVMMVAMMLPSAAPMILLHARVQRTAGAAHPHRATWAFTGGYLVVWTLFSAGATGVQCALERLLLLSPAMVTVDRRLGAAVLLVAGLYQLTPLKYACLNHCRSPLRLVTEHWRAGVGGAFQMGLRHGVYCVGCCWILMGLLFVGGVMNLAWIAVIAGFVLVEKLAPGGRLIARASGVLLLVAAGLLLTVWA